MATIYFTGFEAGNIEEIDGSSGTVSVQSSIKRTGAYALRVNPTLSGTGFGIIASLTGAGASTSANAATAYVRFGFYYATLPALFTEEIFRARNGATLKASIRIDSAGKLNFYDSTNTLIATGATVLSASTWYRIEVKITTSASTTDWEVKINGTSELLGSNFSAVNLLATNNTRWNFGKSVNSNTQSVDFYFDDIFVSDSAYPGDGGCVVSVPSSAGTSQTGTAVGAATHWQAVSEVPEDGDTSYVQTDGTATDAETNTVQNHTALSITGTVNSVRGYILVKRDGGTNGSVKHRLRSNTTNSDATGGATGASYGFQSIIFDTDPATSAAWSLSGLDTLQVGCVENSANKTRMTCSYVFIDFLASAGASVTYPQLEHCTGRGANRGIMLGVR